MTQPRWCNRLVDSIESGRPPVITDSTQGGRLRSRPPSCPRWVRCRSTYSAKPYASWPGWCVNYGKNISITGKMTGKSFGPMEMIIRGLPGWLAWFAGGQPPPARQILAAGIRGGRIRYTPCLVAGGIDTVIQPQASVHCSQLSSPSHMEIAGELWIALLRYARRVMKIEMLRCVRLLRSAINSAPGIEIRSVIALLKNEGLVIWQFHILQLGRTRGDW